MFYSYYDAETLQLIIVVNTKDWIYKNLAFLVKMHFGYSTYCIPGSKHDPLKRQPMYNVYAPLWKKKKNISPFPFSSSFLYTVFVKFIQRLDHNTGTPCMQQDESVLPVK